MATQTHLTNQSQFVQSNAAFAGTNATGTIASNGISVSVNPQTVQTQNLVSIQGSTGNISFINGNGITFGGNASSISASHNGLTSQSNQAVSANNGSYAFQTLSFSNANGISFGTSAGSAITASHNALTTARASNDAIGLNTALTAGPLAWTVNSSGLSLNAGSAAGTTSGFAGNLISGSMTHNTAGLNLSLNHPAWLTTAAQSNHSHGNPSLALTNISGTTASNSAGLTLSLSAGAGGGVSPVASASNGSFSFTTLGFSNANNVTFGTSAGSIITASVAAPGAAAENNWVNLLGANTAGNTTASGSTIGYSGINLTLSGTNGSVVNISAPAVSSLVGTSGVSISTDGSTISVMGVPVTASLWYPYNEAVNVLGQQGNATWQFAPVPTPMDMDAGYVTADRAVFPMFVTNATNSTGTVTVSLSMGLYTKNASSLSLAHSATGSFAVTFSGTVNNSTYAGIRLVTIPFSTSINAARYYVGVAYRTTTGGANATVSQVLVSQLNSNFSGMMGVATNRSYQWPLGLGVLSVSSSGIPASVAFSQIDGTGSLAARPPSWHMRLGTV